MRVLDALAECNVAVLVFILDDADSHSSTSLAFWWVMLVLAYKMTRRKTAHAATKTDRLRVSRLCNSVRVDAGRQLSHRNDFDVDAAVARGKVSELLWGDCASGPRLRVGVGIPCILKHLVVPFRPRQRARVLVVRMGL